MTDRFGVIVVSSDESVHTRIEEVTVVGTPKPGTVLSTLAATEPVNAKFSYEPWNDSADGVQNEVAILLEDEQQGKLVTDAYVTGTQGRVYFPKMGDILQMLVANISGTGDAFAIGDKMIIEDGTGKLIATTGTPEMEPFKIIETVAVALAVDTLVLCRYTGN